MLPERQRPLILIVDDEPHILNVLQIKLETSGYDVVTAENGEEAIDRIISNPPDLVITDLSMPFADGIDLCRAMLKLDCGQKTPALLLTGNWTGLQSDEANSLPNVRGIVTKPFSPNDLIEQVYQVLGRPTPLAQAS